MPVKQLLPAEDVDGTYDLKDLKAPALTGFALRTFLSVFESSFGSWIYPILAQQSGVTQVLHGVSPPEAPSFLPELPVPEKLSEPECASFTAYANAEEAFASVFKDGFLPKLDQAGQPALTTTPTASVRDYFHAYSTGSLTPTQAMERLISFIQASESASPPCAWLVAWSRDDILRQAAESSERFRSGRARPLEGVPFIVKDVADALPYPTTAGTSFIARRRPVKVSAPFVASLQDLGAILLGKSNMHEIGLGVTGLNLRTGTSRNPWHPGHHTGGSSGGSAAAVAAGLCPFAVGSDGGGSIRIPSSFCGTVGLKPTNGRVTGRGGVEIDCTVATYGPIARSVEDCALLYAVLANQDQWVSHGGQQLPPPALPLPLLPADQQGGQQGAGAKSLQGVKLGIFKQWFNHSDPEVLAACNAALELLEGAGACRVDVVVPELELLRVAHTVTITSEMHHNMQDVWDDPKQRAHFNSDVRLALSCVPHWSPADYILCQRIRTRGSIHFRRAFEKADVIVTPTTPCTAPPISPAAASGGASDLGQTSKIMRYAREANFIGLPAISVPVGHDSSGMPIGLQLMGQPWCEATLLRLAAVLEGALSSRQQGQQQGQGQGQAPGGGAGPGGRVPAMWINPVTGKSAGLPCGLTV